MTHFLLPLVPPVLPLVPPVAAGLVEAVYLLAGTVRRARVIQRAACDTRAGLAGQED